MSRTKKSDSTKICPGSFPISLKSDRVLETGNEPREASQEDSRLHQGTEICLREQQMVGSALHGRANSVPHLWHDGPLMVMIHLDSQ